MYKVIIVDDEELLRKGFRSFIPWEKLGFEVVGEFDDGLPAIEYIDIHEVDFVFSDIKMVHSSGIDIAKHIYDAHLDTPICLISGYKDFEYAKQAMYYGVEHYLTKPTVIEEAIETVRQIKNKLDEKRLLKKRNEEYSQLAKMAQHQLFADIFIGNFDNKAAIMQKAELLDLDIQNGMYCPFWILINDYTNYIKNVWKYDKECFFTAIFNFVNDTGGQFDVENIMLNGSELLFVAVTNTEQSTDSFKDIVTKHLSSITQSIHCLLSLETKCHVGNIFMGLSDFADYLARPVWLETDKLLLDHVGVAKGQAHSILPEIYKNIIHSIFLMRPSQIENNLDRVLEILHDSPFDEMKATIINFIKIILDKVGGSTDRDLFSQYHTLLSDFYHCTRADELIEMTHAIILTVADTVSEPIKNDSSAKIVRDAKQFIEQNYMNDISLDDVADSVYMNATYFSRFFKQHTGENFRAYLIQLRVKKANELIHENKYKIYEISKMVGYKNSKYFTSQFKQVTGLTPKEYSIEHIGQK